MANHIQGLEKTIRRRVNGIMSDAVEEAKEALGFAGGDPDDEDEDLDDEDDGETVAEAAGVDVEDLDDYYWFDGDNALAEAAGAYRQIGTNDDHVWHHPEAKLAFIGEPEDFEDWCAEKLVDPDDFDEYATANKIMDLDFDLEPMRLILDEAKSGATSEAKENHKRFRWGKEAHGVGVVTITGVSVPLASIGHMTGLQWLSDRAGTMRAHEYEHDADDGPLPMMFQVDRKTYLIHTKAQTVDQILAAATKEVVKARDYSEFTWSNDAPEIDGITATLKPIGYVTGIQYLADKADGPHDYDHEHGETTGVFPTAFRLDANTILVYSPEIDIREEGICD